MADLLPQLYKKTDNKTQERSDGDGSLDLNLQSPTDRLGVPGSSTSMAVKSASFGWSRLVGDPGFFGGHAFHHGHSSAASGTTFNYEAVAAAMIGVVVVMSCL